MSPAIDHFEYGTWEVQKNARETIKRVGYRYGHLALLRTDFMCDKCDTLHEAWSVANLVSGCYTFPGAVFRNVDDGTAYIYEITPLAKWDEITLEGTAKLIDPLVNICLKHNGLPTRVLDLLLGGRLKSEGVLPGTVAGLNGYVKQ